MSCRSPYADELQTQLNRVHKVAGFPKLSVDGIIGQKTVAAVRLVGSKMGDWAMTMITSCDHVVNDIRPILQKVRVYGDYLGIAATDPHMVMEPLDVSPSPFAPRPPSASSSKIPWVIGALALGYLLIRKKK